MARPVCRATARSLCAIVTAVLAGAALADSLAEGSTLCLRTVALPVAESDAEARRNDLQRRLRDALVQERYANASQSTVERMELSRVHETSADRFALYSMARAGYDQRELLHMLQLVESDDVARTPRTDPFRSHPFIAERVQALRAQITPAPGETARLGTQAYEQGIASVLAIAAEVELDAGLLPQADATIARLLALRPESGRAYYLKAEHARLTERDGRRSAPARSADERAVELAPDDAEAVRALGFLYHDEGNAARATPLLERYLSLVPDAADRKLVERYLGRGGEKHGTRSEGTAAAGAGGP